MFLLLGGSLRSSHHCLHVRWQSCLITEMVGAQPTLLHCCKVPANCYDQIHIHVPWVTRVNECAKLPSALPSLAGEIHADLFGQVSWEDVRGTGLRVFQVEHSHVL